MRGTYRFYQHGRLIAESPNLITTEGSKAILRYLANGGGVLAAGIGVGIGATAATVADRRLTYELERVSVDVTSPDFSTQRIIFKGTLSQALSAKLYEIGIFTTEFSTDSRALVNFDSTMETWTGATFSTVNARNGAEALRLSPAANATATAKVSNLSLNLSTFSTIDEFSLAYQNVANTATIRIRFLAEDGTSYYQYTFTPTTGYNVKTFTKNDMTKVGTVDYSAIASIEFAVTATAGGTSTLDLDGLRIEDKDFLDPRAVMISRSVIPSAPLVKTSLAPMDVEYALDMTLT